MKSVHISTGEKPNTEPTERSNSPDVISSVIASAMRPSSTVKVSVLLMFSGDRKSGLIAAEDGELDDEEHERPELGPGDQAPDERTFASSPITGSRAAEGSSAVRREPG